MIGFNNKGITKNQHLPAISTFLHYQPK